MASNVTYNWKGGRKHKGTLKENGALWWWMRNKWYLNG